MSVACDVLVVGGGPAGAAAARAAVREGARVLLVERHEAPREKVCGEYLCPGGVRALAELGLFPALARSGATPMAGIRLVSPLGREVFTRFPEGAPGASVRRERLDPELVRLSGAEVLRGRRAIGVETGRSGVTVRLEDGVDVEARVVIGADGRNSVLAGKCGLHLPSAGRPRAALHGIFRGVGDGGAGSFGEMHLRGDGEYAGINRTPGGATNVTWVCDLEKARDSGLAERIASTPSLAARFAGARPEGPMRLLAPLEVSVRRTYADGLLLAGDAAGFLDPLTGEGMYGALRTGALAGLWAARAARSGDAPARFLAGYDRDRRRLLGGKERLNRAFQWCLRQPRLLEYLGRRMERFPLVGDRFIGVVGNLLGTRELFRVGLLARVLLPARVA